MGFGLRAKIVIWYESWCAPGYRKFIKPYAMSSYPTVRDPKKDHLVTPQNAALVVIDYQPVQVGSVGSMPRDQLITNIVALTRLAAGYHLPIVLSTVNDHHGGTIKVLREAMPPGIKPIDRTSINAWEDRDFVEAVKATDRRKLIMTALWTEMCLSFPSLDALREGFEVYPVVDAVGGATRLAHDTALRRLEQAGAQLTTVAQLAGELQRDWNRTDTVPVMMEALTMTGNFLRDQA
jgi:nicotinamidase-related amidase